MSATRQARLVRVLAGFLVVLFVAYGPALWQDVIRNWRSKFSWLAAAGWILLVPVFATYALFGEERANRVLKKVLRPMMLVFTLPQRLLEAVDRRIRRHVVVPEGLYEDGTKLKDGNVVTPENTPIPLPHKDLSP